MTRGPTSRAEREEATDRMLATPDGRRELAAELESILFRDALDAFWPTVHDREYGGFFTDLNRKWRPNGAHEKSLEFQARQTCAYARAAQLYPGRGYDEAARQGYAFITERMWDSANGGFFTLVDRRGNPMEHGRKHPHGSVYALEAFAKLEPILGQAVAKQWAQRTFDWLEDVAWDKKNGGYCGYYHRDNRSVRLHDLPSDTPLDWLGTPIGLKDLNVPVDALAALFSFAAYGWDRRASERLDWHLRLFLDRILKHFDLLTHFFAADWTPAPDIPRSGQSLQLISALLAAASGTERAPEALTTCKAFLDRCTSFFAHPRGGFYFARSICSWPLRGVDLNVSERSWWIQLEGSRSLLLLALLCSGEPMRHKAFAKQWAFVEERLIDRRCRGFYESAEDGMKAGRWLANIKKAHIWKDVSHEARFLMDAVGWLRKGPDFVATSAMGAPTQGKVADERQFMEAGSTSERNTF